MRPRASIVALLGAVAWFLSAAGVAQFGAPAPDLLKPDALRVFVCGSASPLGNDPNRAQACIAVIAGEQFFLVDVGAGSAANLGRARLPMGRLSGVLITHYHSDHIADLPGVNLASWVAGRTEPLAVIGPVGVERIVRGFNEAYALDRSYRTAHHGEDLLPAAVGPLKEQVIGEGVILEKDGLEITAFEVEHPPIEPAYGYRFDYAGRSVVVSGDTIATESLAEASKGADLLLHDAMALGVVQQIEGMLSSAGNERMAKVVKDVQDYHATTTSIVELAENAGVRMLAFYHLVPAPPNAAMLGAFTRGLPEGIVVTKDGLLFELPRNTKLVEQRDLF